MNTLILRIEFSKKFNKKCEKHLNLKGTYDEIKKQQGTLLVISKNKISIKKYKNSKKWDIKKSKR